MLDWLQTIDWSILHGIRDTMQCGVLDVLMLKITALIAFSRLYFYVHFPSDVLASVVLGVVIGLAAVKVTKIIVVNKRANTPL